MTRAATRRAFTLIEVMVSIMIFSVMSIAMVGVFSAATSLFRAGESARAASDEATAVMAMLDDDLKRMVAPQDGGFFFTKANMPNTTTPGGNMVLSFKIRNPDPGAVDERGIGARLIVLYWVDHDATTNSWDLHRATATAADSDGSTGSTAEFPVMSNIYTTANATDSVVARGCLYFGIDLSTPSSAGTRTLLNWSACEPTAGTRYCTEASGANPALPYPDAFRISLSITGGNRFGAKGTLILDDGSGIRVAGIKQVPIFGEAVARIDDPETGKAEWIGYDGFTAGKMTFGGGDVRRDLRRTTHTTAHLRGVPVYVCPTFTLVRSLPR